MFWWLSFADKNGPRGVAIIEAPEFLDAVIKTHQLKINPGGEAQGFAAESKEDVKEWRAMGIGRLISVEELRAKGYRSVREMGDEP